MTRRIWAKHPDQLVTAVKLHIYHPPDIRFIVPNGCSTVHRLILIRLGSA
jgi:hypothetical protein